MHWNSAKETLLLVVVFPETRSRKSLKDAESVRHFIYTLRDYSSEEWIVEVDSKNADSGLVYRERSVENMPEGLKSIGIIEYNEEP